MATTAETVFSEFFLNRLGIKPAGAEDITVTDCVGSLEEEMETRTVTKSCRGRVKKSRTKGSSGTLKITAHMPYQLYLAVFGMDGDKYATGVYAYGAETMHKECLITAEVFDEDDNVQYRAYPCATPTTKKVAINDDDTEVAMVELEFTITADENEEIVYQALKEDVSAEIASAWMSDWAQTLIVKETG